MIQLGSAAAPWAAGFQCMRPSRAPRRAERGEAECSSVSKRGFSRWSCDAEVGKGAGNRALPQAAARRLLPASLPCTSAPNTPTSNASVPKDLRGRATLPSEYVPVRPPSTVHVHKFESSCLQSVEAKGSESPRGHPELPFARSTVPGSSLLRPPVPCFDTYRSVPAAVAREMGKTPQTEGFSDQPAPSCNGVWDRARATGRPPSPSSLTAHFQD